MRKLIMIAALNYKNYRNMSRGCTICFFVSTVLLILSISITTGFIRVCNNYVESDNSLHEITIIYNQSDNESKEALEVLKKQKHVEELSVEYNYLALNNESVKPLTIFIDNYCFYMMRLVGVDRKYNVFKKSKINDSGVDEFEILCAGEMFGRNSTKVCVIDENYAYILGYDNPNDLLGKMVKISAGLGVTEEIQIVGVYTYKLGNEQELLKNKESFIYEQWLRHDSIVDSFLIVSDDVAETFCSLENNIYQSNVIATVYVDSIKNVKKVCDYVENVLNLSVQSDVNTIERKQDIANGVDIFLILLSIAMIMVALVTMIGLLMIKRDIQENFMKMMLRIGYTSRDVQLIYCIENLKIFLRGLLPGVVIAFAIAFIFDLVMCDLYKNVSQYTSFLFLPNFRLIVIYCLAAAGVVTLLTISVTARRVKNEP